MAKFKKVKIVEVPRLSEENIEKLEMALENKLETITYKEGDGTEVTLTLKLDKWGYGSVSRTEVKEEPGRKQTQRQLIKVFATG